MDTKVSQEKITLTELREKRRWTNVGNLHVHPMLGRVEIYDKSDKLIESIDVKSIELGEVEYACSFIGNLDYRTSCQVVFLTDTILVLCEEDHLTNIGRKSR